MDSSVVASKALVQVYIPEQDGSTLQQCIMDLNFEKGHTFHCKLRIRAQLHNTVKKAFVYLFLDATHIQSLEISDNDEEGTIPPSVTNAFVQRVSSASSDGIVGLRFVSVNHAPLIAPISMFHKKSSCQDMEALLRIGQCETFTVYVSSSVINMERLLDLRAALAEGSLKPAPAGVINNLYARTKSRIVAHLDELWGSKQPDGPPAYDPSTAPGASNDESTDQSNLKSLNRSKKCGKRRISSPAPSQTPSKRQLLTDKAAPEPWELAIAAQAAQTAALRAELWTLREEVERLRCVEVVDAESNLAPYCVSPSQASTVVNTNEDFLTIVENNIIDRREQRALSDAKSDHDHEQVRTRGLLKTRQRPDSFSL
jgi:hypothetical protein